MPDDGNVLEKKKAHRASHSGRKADKKTAKSDHVQELTDKQRNPKAFAINNVVRAERRFRRNQDLTTKKQHIPLIDRTPLEPPPIIVAVVGPPKVGKSILIQCLIKSFAKMPLSEINGPVTLVSGKKRRITLIECNNDINSMIDIAKVADLVLLLIDASFGFEMEIFEFLNICQVHGMPRIMGVLTHLDGLKNQKQLRKTKKTLKHRFWTEVYSGAKLFYLSGLQYDEYLRNEVANLGRFISVMKFRPLTWRSTHSYVLVDRLEDITPPDLIRQNPTMDRSVSLYGFVRGVPLNKQTSVHIPGCGDFKINDVSSLPDPCPLPDKQKKRSLDEKDRLVYAPFSGVGGILYDKDAVYVELGGSHSHTFRKEEEPGNELVNSLLTNQEPLDVKLARSEMQLFTGGRKLTSNDMNDSNGALRGETLTDESGRTRRKVIFPDDGAEESDGAVVQDEDEGESDGEDSGHESLEEVRDTSAMRMVQDTSDSESGEEGEAPISAVEVPWREKGADRIKSARLKLKASLGEDYADDSDSDSEPEPSTESRAEPEKELYHGLSTAQDKQVSRKISEALSMLDSASRRPSRLTASEQPDSDGSESDVSESDGHACLKRKHEDCESEEEDSAVRWKRNLSQKAADAFLERQSTSQNLWKLVYGKANVKTSEAPEDEGDDVGGLFRVVDKKQRDAREQRDVQDGLDCAKFVQTQTRDWDEEDVRELIRDCFVTGKWKESEDAEELLKLDDASDGELYGDFEDLETGETHKTETTDESKTRREVSKEKIMEKKAKLKARFDADYDNQEGKTYYDDLKSEVDTQAQLNKNEFEGMAEEMRLQLEGFRAGLYVRVEIANVPCELITNFDPSYPLIMGGLQAGEENIGYVQVRTKKHRWHKKILKTRDPLIISLGWRRFQSLPLYAKLEDNMRQRYLKYTPEHVTCVTHFYGPITPQNTGFLAVQDVATQVAGFRIALTGTVVELDKSTQIMKKLKLTGTPLKIYTKTAFIQGMFNSALEVARFEGAKLKTVSGIRGQIKKASKKPEGSFRATFEDKIQLSDIVFCRTWYRVDVPTLYNPVTSLLLPRDQKNSWRGMKTVGQLKRENNIRAQVSTDNFYTPVVRTPKLFRPLVIPKALQRELPYKDKPKLGASKSVKSLDSKRIAVIREPHEQAVNKMIKMMKTSYADKQERMKKETSVRMNKYKKRVEAEEVKQGRRQRDLRKQVFRTLSKMEITSKAKAEKRR